MYECNEFILKIIFFENFYPSTRFSTPTRDYTRGSVIVLLLSVKSIRKEAFWLFLDIWQLWNETWWPPSQYRQHELTTFTSSLQAGQEWLCHCGLFVNRLGILEIGDIFILKYFSWFVKWSIILSLSRYVNWTFIQV